MNNKYKKFIIIFLLTIILFQFFGKDVGVGKSERYTDEQREKLIRFGITAPLGVVGYDLSTIHALTYLDWAKESSTVPAGVEYIHVIRVGDDVYNNGGLLTKLPITISNNIGDVWIIGNEPDRFCDQDSVNPELYGQRYFEIATLIRSLDPTAKLGFGSIVQPTPIRIRYLQRALDRLIELSGNNEELAFGLIDIWSIHAFILNEKPYNWGADVPVGFYTYDKILLEEAQRGHCYTGEQYETDINDAIVISDFSDTYSIEIFKERIYYFRNWLNSIGESNKPLWITEYGSLFPDWEVKCQIEPGLDCESPYNGWPFQENSKKYLIDTFNFLLYTSDPVIGFPLDDHHLVQRWFWYSLNGNREEFGGTLFDPNNDKQITNLGIAYKNYIELLIGPKIYLPILLKNNFIIQ
ncbi:MAG: hypothetical protein RBT01_15820 [Anaerolineaceae bacterium]|jgi:hypothetical protein|nr:hypothetical protein [Anaerolineaceae bacterium]